MINTILQIRESCFWKRLFSSYVVLIIIFSCLLFLFNLGKRDLWAPDEPRYAQVSKEMWESNDFVLPHLNGEKYPDKPPILFWLIILFSIPFGAVTELSARLPSALAGIGCAITTYYFGKRLFSARVGFLSALVLSTSIEYFIKVRRVSFDGLLTFIITLSLFLFHTGYIRKEKKTKFFLFSYLLMGIATITKGPIGFIIPILIISAFLCVEKWKKCKSEFRIRDMRIWLGVVIVFSIPLLWVFGIYLQGGWEHTKEVVFTQNIGRTVNSWSHKQPFYYFFTQFPLGFMPWTIFIPSVIIYYIKTVYKNPSKLRSGTSNTGNDANALPTSLSVSPTKSSLLFPAVWFIVVFTFFSIMSCKRQAYILPLYPAAALLVGWFLDAFFLSTSDKLFKRIGYLPLQIAYGIIVVMGIAIPVWAYYYQPEFFTSALLISIIIICGAIVSARYLFKGKPAKAVMSSFVVFLIIVMVGSQVVIPKINEKKSARYFCEKVNKIIGLDGKFASLNFFRSTYLFYTGKKSMEVITDMEKFYEYISSDERVFLLLRKEALEAVKQDIDIEIYPLVEDTIGHRTMVLISNKPQSDEINEY
ncbi:MAG: ArnT family glycosyltransferase [Candidatus Anammoxibacter sp.]